MEEFIQVIKDYGAAIISSISVGGVAAIAGIIIKAKKAIDETKNKIADMNKKKEESETALSERYKEMQTTIADQNKKLDTLTEEISRVKGHRKN